MSTALSTKIAFDKAVWDAKTTGYDPAGGHALIHVIATESGSVYRIDEWNGTWFIYQERGDTLDRAHRVGLNYHPQLLAVASDIATRRLKMKLGIVEGGKALVLKSTGLAHLATLLLAAAKPAPSAHPECDWCNAVANGTVVGGPSHDGSPRCPCGSIASGGGRAHCACDWCF
jgi:hypothetical protein